MRFVLGVLTGLAVGVLATWPDAGPIRRTERPAPIVRARSPVAISEPPREVRAGAAASAGPSPMSHRARLRVETLVASGSYTDALRAADLLARRGEAVDHLEWAFREAIIRIDAYRSGDPSAVAIEALRAVCRNRVAWRPEALAAARMLAGRARHEVQVCARDTVIHLRPRVHAD